MSKQTKQEEQILSQYRYIKKLADEKYSIEERRETSLIQQSGQLQTAFSFITGAVFMIVPICLEYRGSLPLWFFLISLSIFTICIIVSLILASVVQWRWKTETFPDIEVLKDSIINSREWQKLTEEYNQLAQHVDLLSKLQKEKARLNDRRVKLIMGSMIFFWISIACIIISFILGMIYILR